MSIVLGVVVGLLLHVVFLRITTLATDYEYRTSRSWPALAAWLARCFVWLAWVFATLHHEGDTATFFTALAWTGFVTWILGVAIIGNKSDKDIAKSKFLSWLDAKKLIPMCYNRLRNP